MLRSPKPDRTEHEKIGGEKAVVEFYRSDPDYYTRVEVEREETWVLGVDEEGVAQLLETTDTADDVATGVDLPAWLVETLYGIGISEIRS
jgi:hypothetical protein